MLSSLQIGNGYGMPRFTLPMNHAKVVVSIFVAPLLLGWSGRKGHMKMDELSPDDIEFLIDLLIEYQDTRDLNQREWGTTKALMDKLDALLGD